MPPSTQSSSKKSLKRPHQIDDQTKSSKKKKKYSETKDDDLSPVVRREHASTFTASVDHEIKKKLEILKRSTLRPIVIYYEPADARMTDVKWRLYPFKNNQPLPIMYLHRQSSYIIGRNFEVCDVHIRHCSCSNQHAVLQYRQVQGNESS